MAIIYDSVTEIPVGRVIYQSEDGTRSAEENALTIVRAILSVAISGNNSDLTNHNSKSNL
ncbi:MAG: hypothetical protein ACOC04_04355 [Halothece sp.]